MGGAKFMLLIYLQEKLGNTVFDFHILQKRDTQKASGILIYHLQKRLWPGSEIIFIIVSREREK